MVSTHSCRRSCAPIAMQQTDAVCAENWYSRSISSAAMGGMKRRAFIGLLTGAAPDSTHKLTSPWRPRRPFQPDQAAHIIDQGHPADLHGPARQPHGTHKNSAHPIFLILKHVFDGSEHRPARGVGGLLPLR